MSKPFNRPNCGAPLDYPGGDAATISCPFCHNYIIIPKEVRAPKVTSPDVFPATPGEGTPSAPPSTPMPELANLEALAATVGLSGHELRKIERARHKIVRHQIKEEERKSRRH